MPRWFGLGRSNQRNSHDRALPPKPGPVLPLLSCRSGAMPKDYHLPAPPLVRCNTMSKSLIFLLGNSPPPPDRQGNPLQRRSATTPLRSSPLRQSSEAISPRRSQFRSVPKSENNCLFQVVTAPMVVAYFTIPRANLCQSRMDGGLQVCGTPFPPGRDNEKKNPPSLQSDPPCGGLNDT